MQLCIIVLALLVFYERTGALLFNGKVFRKVIKDPANLQLDTTNVTYPGRSLMQCASETLRQPELWKLFCLNNVGDCLLVDIVIPAYYDDKSGGGGYKCYTSEEPFIDRG